jgi:hypothetical protein
MPKPIEDLTGRRFKRLVVVSHSHQGKGGKTYFNCVCDCGGNKVAHRRSLLNGDTGSCGCLYIETRNTTHGLSDEHLYKVWSHMMSRCYNKKDRSYFRYGGRGITVCKEWHDVEVFYKWAIVGYQKGLTIDRENNNDGYCPDNCRWVTDTKQANNRRNNKFLEYNGKRHTIAEWAKIMNISESALRQRIDILKWDVEKALTTLVRVKSQ